MCVCVCDCIPLTGVRLQHVSSELYQPLSGQLDLVQLIAEALVLSVKLGCFCLAQALKGELYNRETASVVMHVGVAKLAAIVYRKHAVNDKFFKLYCISRFA